MSGKSTNHLAPAEGWGNGVTRRAIRLRGMPGKVEAALADMRHAMICTLHHNGKVVTEIEADFRRYTLDICPGASAPLQAVVGMSLGTTTAEFFANGRSRQNCTHMLDLAWLALRHASRGETEWLYEIEIPDVLEGPQDGTLRRNGEVVQQWQVMADRFVLPARHTGQSMGGGFSRWVTGEAGLSDLEIEEYLVLNRGFFMVGARQFELPVGPMSEAFRLSVKGACYGYGADRIDGAIGNAGMGRDFSHSPDKLLRFE